MNIDEVLKGISEAIQEERASCIEDIELARLQSSSEEFRKGCDASMEAIRTRFNRRKKAKLYLTEERPLQSNMKLVGK